MCYVDWRYYWGIPFTWKRRKKEEADGGETPKGKTQETETERRKTSCGLSVFGSL